MYLGRLFSCAEFVEAIRLRYCLRIDACKFAEAYLPILSCLVLEKILTFLWPFALSSPSKMQIRLTISIDFDVVPDGGSVGDALEARKLAKWHLRPEQGWPFRRKWRILWQNQNLQN